MWSLSRKVFFSSLLLSAVCTLAMPIASSKADLWWPLCLLSTAGCQKPEPEPVYPPMQLRSGVFYASSRRWESHGLEWLTQDGREIRASGSVPHNSRLGEPSRVVVFVHGFRGTPDVLDSYFGEMTDNLLSSNVKQRQFVVFDWPSTARAWGSLSFMEQQLYLAKQRMYQTCWKWNPSTRLTENDTYCEIQKSSPLATLTELASWESAQYLKDQSFAGDVGAPSLAGLVEQLYALNPGIIIDVVAHSMGCYVVQQMLETFPAVKGRIRNIIWLAPDVDYTVLAHDKFREALHGVERLYIFFSKDDSVLRYVAPVPNWKRRLGAIGPKTMRTIPDNVTVCDLTGMLENDHDIVHSMYLRIVGPVPQMIAEITLDRHFACPPERNTAGNEYASSASHVAKEVARFGCVSTVVGCRADF